MIKIDMGVKWIQDPRRLIAIMNKANEKAVRRSGPKVRGFMRRIIKTSKKKRSLPGKPPKSHTQKGQFGLKMIVYKYNPRQVAMYVGPLVRNDDVPGTLEKGGTTAIRTKEGTVRAVIAARPWAKPALDQYRDKFAEEWRQIIS